MRCVGTILRAAAHRDGIAEVRTGGDLLADSDPAREEHESRVKAVSLWRALGLSVAATLQTRSPAGRTRSDRMSAVRDDASAAGRAAARSRCTMPAIRSPAAMADALQACGVSHRRRRQRRPC